MNNTNNYWENVIIPRLSNVQVRADTTDNYGLLQ